MAPSLELHKWDLQLALSHLPKTCVDGAELHSAGRMCRQEWLDARTRPNDSVLPVAPAVHVMAFTGYLILQHLGRISDGLGLGA